MFTDEPSHGPARASFGKALIACLSLMGSAGAQTVLPDSAGASIGGQVLEQITVRAERREMDLQQAPVAITAIGASALDQSNVTQLADLNGLVPGLTIATSSGFERMVSIRGIGSETPENAFTTQPGVSLHVDGVYIANSISLDQTLFDVDQIEISRGPQATVFGQASTGGSINLIGKQPQLDRYDAYIDVSGGSYDLYRSRGILNVPIGETFAIRGSAQIFSHEGFAPDTDLPGFRLGDADERSGKLAMLWRPSQDFAATLTAQLYHAHHDGEEQKNILDPNPDPYVVSQDYPSLFRLDTQLYYLNLKWDLPRMQLKSTSSWQVLNNHIQEDGTRLDVALIGYFDHVQAWNTFMHDLTQELSIASQPGAAIDWTLGGLYLAQINHQFVDERSDVGGNPAPFLLYDNDAHIDRHSYSAYAQATDHPDAHWRLTLGARYNHDRYSGPSTSFGVTTDDTYSKGVGTGKAEVQYDLAAGSMEYASFTRGYKPGGVNDNPGAVLVPHLFRPESINAYELGSKNRLPGDTLLLNAAAYYYDYRNMQYIANDPVPFKYGIDNIPAARIVGFELESSYLTLDKHLRINGNLSLAHGTLVGNFKTLDAKAAARLTAASPDCAFGGAFFSPACWAEIVAGAPNTNGNEVPKLPHLQGGSNAGYTAELGAWQLLSRIEYIYRGPFEYRIFNDGLLDRVGGYSQWNLYLQLAAPGRHLSCSLVASNLFDVAGINSRYTDPFGTGQTSNEYIPPRQLIATVAYQF
jgi:iron complex outermembrane receptor protein